MECELLTALDFWVDVFVDLPIRPVCSKLPAQTKAVWSLVACLTLNEVCLPSVTALSCAYQDLSLCQASNLQEF